MFSATRQASPKGAYHALTYRVGCPSSPQPRPSQSPYNAQWYRPLASAKPLILPSHTFVWAQCDRCPLPVACPSHPAGTHPARPVRRARGAPSPPHRAAPRERPL
eukprot:2252863-Prymnesium_polylepis.1